MKDIIKIFISLFIAFLIFFGIYKLFTIPSEVINGIDNYDKNYYVRTYRYDLNSNLSIFPDDKSKLVNSEFYSSFDTFLFDSVDYLILDAKYNEEEFNNEINRLSNISMTIKAACAPNSKTYTNYIKYDENSYDYKAYIAIDGYAHLYEYALINDNENEIIYIYLSNPSIKNDLYSKYLKKDKDEYFRFNTLDSYSIYNHAFGKNVISEYDDC